MGKSGCLSKLHFAKEVPRPLWLHEEQHDVVTMHKSTVLYPDASCGLLLRTTSAAPYHRCTCYKRRSTPVWCMGLLSRCPFAHLGPLSRSGTNCPGPSPRETQSKHATQAPRLTKLAIQTHQKKNVRSDTTRFESKTRPTHHECRVLARMGHVGIDVATLKSSQQPLNYELVNLSIDVGSSVAIPTWAISSPNSRLQDQGCPPVILPFVFVCSISCC